MMKSKPFLVVLSLVLVLLVWVLAFQVQINSKLDFLLSQFSEIADSQRGEAFLRKHIPPDIVAAVQREVHVPLPTEHPPHSSVAPIKMDLRLRLRDPNDDSLYLPAISGMNVVSMSLYGSDPRYTTGVVRNAQLISDFFPGWKLRVYVPEERETRASVPQETLSALRAAGADVHFVTGESSVRVSPMMWRFLIADDMSVDRFVVRDADSRLNARDAAAIYAWIRSDAAFNCIRDHPSHATAVISGGMWGGKPMELRKLVRKPWSALMRGVRNEYQQDMDFLKRTIWPLVKHSTYCSDSVSCDRWPSAHPFPVRRVAHEHVGQVYDHLEIARAGDIEILSRTPPNQRCVPH